MNTFKSEGVVEEVIQLLSDEHGDVAITNIALRHGTTLRTLQRLFQQQVGISPKQFARLERFKHVYSLLQKPTWSKADSLFLSGYFDQPHFNKEFKSFTNENPDKWFSHRNEFANLFMNR